MLSARHILLNKGIIVTLIAITLIPLFNKTCLALSIIAKIIKQIYIT